MISKGSGRSISIWIGVAFVVFSALFLYFSPPPFGIAINFLENVSYDLLLRNEYKPVSKETPVVIIDIDDESLNVHGRWPWSRKILSDLVSNLFKAKAKVVAFDIMFSEPEVNLADKLIKELKSIDPSATLSIVEENKELFDYDKIFAKTLSLGSSVLGFVFTNSGNSVGQLPPPFLTLPKEWGDELFIAEMEGYISNVPILEQSAKGGGFINSNPDQDGILRFSPLLIRRGEMVYSSLALEAVKLFLDNQQIQLKTGKYGEETVLEGIGIGEKIIPTDPWGRVLIPFRGPPYSISYIPAFKVLSGAVSQKEIEGKIVFVGSSASAMSDSIAAAIAPIFPGIEIHAQIAAGILDDYMPYKPTWGRGVAVLLVLGLGLFCAFVFPFLGPIASLLVLTFLSISLLALDHFIWKTNQIVLSSIFPIFTLVCLFVINEILGYFLETGRRKQMRSVFGQYVPPDCIDSMLEVGGSFGVEGQTKELSVLFADIRNFTSISEGLSASEIKKYLNGFLTPMTEVIFKNKGTIDKYVGDMIMAFWGAPLEDALHPQHALYSAFEMQKKLLDLNVVLKEKKLPEIHIGIGINTGLMDVGDMGSVFRRAYTVLGDSVNLASRLEGLTKYYHVDILVGENTFEKTKSLFLFRKIDCVRVKGKEQKVSIYEPLCQTETCDKNIISRLEIHNQALDAYSQQQWDKAETLFKQLLESDPNRLLYEMYLARLAQYRFSPPPPSWDGSFTVDFK